MALNQINLFLPPGALPYLEKWVKPYGIHFKITRDRKSKLGDYRPIRGGRHQITINGTLSPELFFFVLTHELAHLIAGDKYGRGILPHGNEWKKVFGFLLLESIEIYSKDLQKLLIPFSKNPKANFMASPELVKYFEYLPSKEGEIYVEDLREQSRFLYRGREFELKGKLKKNYLCQEVFSGKEYRFSPLARVEKITSK